MAIRLALGKRIIASFFLGMLLLLGVGLALFFNANSIESITQQKHQEAISIEALNKTLGSVIDAETGQRGYLVTGKEHFLEPFNAAEIAIHRQLRTVENLISDNQAQIERFHKLVPLVEQKFALTRETIRLFRSGRTSEARNIEQQEEGKRVMDQIRVLITEMADQESMHFWARLEEIERATFVFRVVTATVVLLSLALIVLAFRLTNSDAIRRDLHEEGLERSKRAAQEASDLKSAFLANMSHEIRTPMNGVIGMTEMLLKTDLSEDQKKYVDIISQSSSALLTLINSILDLSKIESGRLELEKIYFEVKPLIENAISTVRYSAEKRGLRIQSTMQGDLPAAYSGDPTRIRQILVNLLGNAVKFSDRGTIHVDVTCTRGSSSRMLVKFEIRDEGIGMADDAKDRLFKAFSQGDQSTTRKYGGTGLGLSITKQLVDLMHGKIEVESQLGRGSVFTVTLPLEPVAPLLMVDSQRPPGVDSPVGTDPLRILVAEDNDINWEVLTLMLKRLGHDAVFVRNGALAVEKAKAEAFDLVLMDCHMPEMDGYTATREIRALEGGRLGKMPIIAITANAVKGDMAECLEAGMNDYISKPMSLSDLAIKLQLWSPKAVQPSPQVLDLAVINSLRELEQEDPPVLVPKLVSLFLDSKNSIERIQECFASGLFQKMSDEAHKLKSSCANVGLVRMRRVCQKIENGPTEDMGELKYQIAQLELEYDLAVRHLGRADLLPKTHELARIKPAS